MRAPVSVSYVLLLILSFLQAEGQSVFDTLRKAPADKRIKLARDIYKKEFRRTDSVTTFNGFKQLFEIARSLDDKPLECWIYDFHADYFSVNRGFNTRSPDYHQQAIGLAIKYNLPAEVAIHTYKKAMFYNTWQKYVEANRYLLEAYDLFKAAGFENVPEISRYLHDFSIFYYRLGDLESAQAFVLEALKYKSSAPDIELSMTNTLALIYQGNGDDEKALSHFTKGLQLVATPADSIWIGIISGNVGDIYFARGEFEKAKQYFEIGYSESLKYGDDRIAAQSLLFLAKCNLIQGNTQLVADQLAMAEPLVKKVNVLDRWILFYATMAQLSEKNGNTSDALLYWKSYNGAKDSLDNINNIAAVDRVKLRWEMDKHKVEIDQLKTDAQTEVFKRNATLFLLFLLMIISVLLYNRQLLKRRKEKEIFEKSEKLLHSEKARAEQELTNATQMLERYTGHLKQKNELIEKFKAEIEQLHLQRPDIVDTEKIAALEKLMQAHIMTDDTWDEFKRLFDKVHGGFIFRIKEKFTQATESDVRLLTLIKLGLNNREMANMLGVTTEAIKKSRQRLRKKISLPEDQSIEEVVALI